MGREHLLLLDSPLLLDLVFELLEGLPGTVCPVLQDEYAWVS